MPEIPYNWDTKLLGLLGWPLGHSIVPRVHNALYRYAGINAVLLPIELEDAPGNLDRFFSAVRTLRMGGFIVTMPYKSRMLPYLDEVPEACRALNCVNAVRFDGENLYGAAYDGYGLCQAIEDTGHRLEGREALIIGAGGICGPVISEMAKRGVESFTILNRSPESAERKAEVLQSLIGRPVQTGPLTEESLDRAAGRADLVAQCTPLGMYGTGTSFPYLGFLEKMGGDTVVADVVYNPPRTALLQAAARRGLQTVNGTGMLVHQAEKLTRFFFGSGLGPEGKSVAGRAVEAALEDLRL